MFLNQTIQRNPKLIKACFELHQTGLVLPDTYVIDLDVLLENARMILDEANRNNIKMYFMLKQLGRNPKIASELIKLGYAGAVAVDFKEAQLYMHNKIPISNVGHLVQTPRSLLKKLVDYGCEYFTIYSLQKARDINACLKGTNKKQKIMLRVISDEDKVYSGQRAGFQFSDLDNVIDELKTLEHIDIKGVTSFPCFLYNEATQKNEPTPNLFTVLKAKAIIEQRGIMIENVNAPSATSVDTIREMAHYAVNSGEPGHGLSGTTPLHAVKESKEQPCVVYVSEVSHVLRNKSECYGGGHYRRSNVENALVGSEFSSMKQAKVIAPDLESIDYHFGLNGRFDVNDTVLMAFRFQIFVTRSTVCIVKGIQRDHPEIIGFYTSLGVKQ